MHGEIFTALDKLFNALVESRSPTLPTVDAMPFVHAEIVISWYPSIVVLYWSSVSGWYNLCSCMLRASMQCFFTQWISSSYLLVLGFLHFIKHLNHNFPLW